jgi:hypothetical protein
VLKENASLPFTVSPEAVAGKSPPDHPLNGNEGRKGKRGNSEEGDGKVNVMHAWHLPSFLAQ